jgi:hypothetical protein
MIQRGNISPPVRHVCFHGEFRGITERDVDAKKTAGIVKGFG